MAIPARLRRAVDNGDLSRGNPPTQMHVGARAVKGGCVTEYAAPNRSPTPCPPPPQHALAHTHSEQQAALHSQKAIYVPAVMAKPCIVGSQAVLSTATWSSSAQGRLCRETHALGGIQDAGLARWSMQRESGTRAQASLQTTGDSRRQE